MTEEIAQFYRILELEPGASPEVVKQAYRELVKIWHPDRFPNDPKFQKRANEKTKEINEAYKKILAYQTGNWSESRLPRSGDESGAAARAEADAAKRVRQSQARERQVTMDPRDGGGLPEFAWRSARKLGTLFPVFNRYTLLYAALASVWVFFVKPSFFPSKAETFLNTKSAAEKGDVSAQFNLGWRYANGESIGQDYVEAAKWYRKAAEQGHTDAQSNLGWMYESGHGVPQNYGEAFRWYSTAAERGDAYAQNNLGTMYQNGRAVSQDPLNAYSWYSLAAAQGNTNALSNRDNLIRWLTSEQIAEGQRRAAEFVPRR